MGPIYAYLRETERLEKCKQNSKQLLPARGSWHGLYQHTARCAIFNLAARAGKSIPTRATVWWGDGKEGGGETSSPQYTV